MISIRPRVHNESLLQEVTDGNAKGLVYDQLDGAVEHEANAE
jgi:hypothetical protein